MTGENRSDSDLSSRYSSSVRSMSAAATLLSSCATVDAPGIATTTGLRISQASATWDGVTVCASATWRSAAIRSVAFSRFSGRNNALLALTRFDGRL